MIQRTDHSTERSAKKRGSSNYALAAADCVIDRFRSLRNCLAQRSGDREFMEDSSSAGKKISI